MIVVGVIGPRWDITDIVVVWPRVGSFDGKRSKTAVIVGSTLVSASRPAIHLGRNRA